MNHNVSPNFNGFFILYFVFVKKSFFFYYCVQPDNTKLYFSVSGSTKNLHIVLYILRASASSSDLTK